MAFIWVGTQRSDVLELSHNQEVYYISYKFYHCDFLTIDNIFVIFMDRCYQLVFKCFTDVKLYHAICHV